MKIGEIWKLRPTNEKRMLEMTTEMGIRLHSLACRVVIINVSNDSVEFQDTIGEGWITTFGRRHFIGIYYKDYDENR